MNTVRVQARETIKRVMGVQKMMGEEKWKMKRQLLMEEVDLLALHMEYKKEKDAIRRAYQKASDRQGERMSGYEY